MPVYQGSLFIGGGKIRNGLISADTKSQAANIAGCSPNWFRQNWMTSIDWRLKELAIKNHKQLYVSDTPFSTPNIPYDTTIMRGRKVG